MKNIECVHGCVNKTPHTHTQSREVSLAGDQTQTTIRMERGERDVQ
jgi:hypothetical protein